MDTAARNNPSWPSLACAFLLDGLLILVPLVVLLLIAEKGAGHLAGYWTAVAPVSLYVQYAKGFSLGSMLAGIRFSTRKGQSPGYSYAGLMLIFAIVFWPCIVIMLFMNLDGPGPWFLLESPDNGPIVMRRVARRRLLILCDRYWREWTR